MPPETYLLSPRREYVEIVKKQLPQLPVENIVAEPSKKNTAPCIAYIAFKLFQKDPDALMIAAPADNLILETDEFVKTAAIAFNFVDHINALVTIGIKPTYPNTRLWLYTADMAEALLRSLK
ncbi:MAG: hypothetical protein WDO16_10410 [Bacteroidota bacterium]